MSLPNTLERAMLKLINDERAAVGIAPLTFDNKLNAAAEDYSAEMLENNVFSHTGVDGSTPRERMSDAGYVFSGRNASGENIAYQSERGEPGLMDDVADLHLSLMNSPGHRANILNATYDEIGIGIVEGGFTASNGFTFNAVMVTQNFALTQAEDTPSVPTEVVIEQPLTPVFIETDEPPVEEAEEDKTPVIAMDVPEPVDVVPDQALTPNKMDKPENPGPDGADDGEQPDTPIAMDKDTDDDDEPEIVAAPEMSDDDDTDDAPVMAKDEVDKEPEVVAAPDMSDDDDEEPELIAAPDMADDDDEKPEVVAAPDTADDDNEEPELIAAPDMSDDVEEEPEVVAAPDMSDDDEDEVPVDNRPFFSDDEDDSGPVYVWKKTHSDETYAEVIENFSLYCEDPEEFAALDRELQAFVAREVDCEFDLA